MVKITLEYPSVDAAIVAMAKLTKADGVTINAEGKPRKGRADAGQPRGKYNKKGAEEAGSTDANTGVPASPAAPTEQPAAPAMESPQAPGKDHAPVAAGSAPEAPAKVVTAADAEKALETLFQAAPPKGGLEVARTVLAKFGVQRLRDLPEGQRAAFVEAATKALA